MTRFLSSWAPALFCAGLIFYLSSQSNLAAVGYFPFSDKVAHFLLFAVFGMALAWGGKHISPIRLHAGLVLLGIVYGGLDELHQSFVPLRHPSAGDLVADALGVLVGYVLTAALLRARNKAQLNRL